MNKPAKINMAARSKARRLVLQAMYQWQVAEQSIAEIGAQYALDENMPKADAEYFNELLKGISTQQKKLDEQLTPFIDRPFADLDPVTLAILRIAFYELTARPEIPYRVVINEAVELGKTFGATDSYKYINGVLDKAAQQLRSVERQ